MHQLPGRWRYESLPTCQIDAWMWSEEDFEVLIPNQLAPLQRLIDGEPEEMFDAWLPMVTYDVDYD